MAEIKHISRRHLIDQCVSDQDIEDALELLKHGVLAQDTSAAKTLIDLTIGTKRDFDALLLASQRNTLDMLKYLVEKGIASGMENQELIELIRNFDITKFTPANYINENYTPVSESYAASYKNRRRKKEPANVSLADMTTAKDNSQAPTVEVNKDQGTQANNSISQDNDILKEDDTIIFGDNPDAWNREP